MKMPLLNCSGCGKEDTVMVDAPYLDDSRQYCPECYARLFPPGWTDEQPFDEPDDDPHGVTARNAWKDDEYGLSDGCGS